MAYKIEEIEGIDPVYAAKLVEAGIKTTKSLLSCCGDPHGRDTLSQKAAISPHLILKWTNMAAQGLAAKVTDLASAAAAKKEELTKNWTDLSGGLPGWWMSSASESKSSRNPRNCRPGSTKTNSRRQRHRWRQSHRVGTGIQ